MCIEGLFVKFEMSITSLTDEQKDAAPVLEFNYMSTSHKESMMEDMAKLYPYRKGEHEQILMSVLKHLHKKIQILDHINGMRGYPLKSDLRTRMTDSDVETKLDELDEDNVKATKYWYYHLYPKFTPGQIRERHEEAIASISQNELDAMPRQHSKFLTNVGEMWIEYYNFELPDPSERNRVFKHMRFIYPFPFRITNRVCLKILQNIKRDPTRAKIQMLCRSLVDVDECISNEVLESILFKMLDDFTIQFDNQTDEENEFILRVFSEFGLFVDAEAIKDRASEFYRNRKNTGHSSKRRRIH